MPLIQSPFGFRPVKSLGNRPFAVPNDMYRIASGQATNLFFGQPVALSSGNIVPATAGFAGYIGIFMGCQYTDPTFGFIQRQYWPSGTIAADAKAFVADDPDMIFRTQLSVASFNADNGVGLRYTANLPAAPNDGRVSTGNSLAGMTGTAAGSGEWLLLGRVDEPDNANAVGYVDVLVVAAQGMHIARRLP
jgi:hypothetical protein